MAKNKMMEIVGAVLAIMFLYYLSQVIFKDLGFGPFLSPGLFILMLIVLFIGFVIIIYQRLFS